MTYTEIKERNGKKYYYRVRSIRKGNKFKKNRIYLGVNLNKNDLGVKKGVADKKLDIQRKKERLGQDNKIILQIKKILKKNKIKRAGIFGSFARGEQKKDSDIDILIEPGKGLSLLDISGLKIELEGVLNKKVDLVSYKYIHPYLKKKILESEVKIIWKEI